MKNKRLIFIVGKTSSGKDTVAKYISESFKIPMVCSYTTRPKRDYETNGVEHWFVSKERMKEILETEKVLAYTKFNKTDIEYCATLESLTSDTTIYIINPEGIRCFEENCTGIDFFSIYVDLPEDIILERARNRGDKLKTIITRLDSERVEMNLFKLNKEYDYYIDNTGSYKDLISNVDYILTCEEILHFS